MSGEWRHRPDDRDTYCVYCTDDTAHRPWPCDAEQMRAERDAAIRRAEELEAALRDAVDVVDRATSENNDSIPLYDFLAEDAARLIDAARAALAEAS